MRSVEFAFAPEEESAFRPVYRRNQKAGGQKNVRCFPSCSRPRHNRYGFCGRKIRISSSSSNNSQVELFGRIALEQESACFAVGDTVSRRWLATQLRSAKTPRNHWIKAEPMSDVSSPPRLLFEFNRDKIPWHYDWNAKKFSKQTVFHQFKVFCFVQAQEDDDDIIQCVETLHSTPFQILSSRGKRSRDCMSTAKKKQCKELATLSRNVCPKVGEQKSPPLILLDQCERTMIVMDLSMIIEAFTLAKDLNKSCIYYFNKTSMVNLLNCHDSTSCEQGSEDQQMSESLKRLCLQIMNFLGGQCLSKYPRDLEYYQQENGCTLVQAYIKLLLQVAQDVRSFLLQISNVLLEEFLTELRKISPLGNRHVNNSVNFHQLVTDTMKAHFPFFMTSSPQVGHTKATMHSSTTSITPLIPLSHESSLHDLFSGHWQHNSKLSSFDDAHRVMAHLNTPLYFDLIVKAMQELFIDFDNGVLKMRSHLNRTGISSESICDGQPHRRLFSIMGTPSQSGSRGDYVTWIEDSSINTYSLQELSQFSRRKAAAAAAAGVIRSSKNDLFLCRMHTKMFVVKDHHLWFEWTLSRPAKSFSVDQTAYESLSISQRISLMMNQQWIDVDSHSQCYCRIVE